MLCKGVSAARFLAFSGFGLSVVLTCWSSLRPSLATLEIQGGFGESSSLLRVIGCVSCNKFSHFRQKCYRHDTDVYPRENCIAPDYAST